MKGLRGKNVLVTGGSSGIGQAIAIRLGEEGANVAINYRKGAEEAQHTAEVIHERVAAAVDQCMSQMQAAGAKTLLVQADISKEDDVKKMFDENRDSHAPKSDWTPENRMHYRVEEFSKYLADTFTHMIKLVEGKVVVL